MEAASRGSGLARQPTLEDGAHERRSPHFENVDKVVQELQELETENDELRKEVLRLTDSQERRGSLGDSSVDPLCRRPSAASRKGSVLSVRRSFSRRDSLDLSRQLEAAMQENEELSDRLRFLEQERQRAQERQAGQEAAMAELGARMRQLEQEHEELGSRHEHLVAMMAARTNPTPATGSTMRSSRLGSIDMSADADFTVGHFKRSSCEVLVEAPLKRSLNAAQTQVVGLEVDLAKTRLDRDRLLQRVGQLETECEELRTMLGQQREASVMARLDVERLQEELLLERQPSMDGRRADSKGWDLLRQLMQAGGDLNAEDLRPRRGSTGSTCSDRAGVSPTRCEASEAQAAILALQRECEQLREELSRREQDSREAREDAARVPELLSDIVRLQDELSTAQTAIRRYEEQNSPDLWTRMIDSIACTGSRPLSPQPEPCGHRPVRLAVPSGG